MKPSILNWYVSTQETCWTCTANSTDQYQITSQTAHLVISNQTWRCTLGLRHPEARARSSRKATSTLSASEFSSLFASTGHCGLQAVAKCGQGAVLISRALPRPAELCAWMTVFDIREGKVYDSNDTQQLKGINRAPAWQSLHPYGTQLSTFRRIQDASMACSTDDPCHSLYLALTSSY